MAERTLYTAQRDDVFAISLHPFHPGIAPDERVAIELGGVWQGWSNVPLDISPFPLRDMDDAIAWLIDDFDAKEAT